MSGAQRIARELNRLVKDGFDGMGGADGEALNRLLEDYYGEEELPGCKLSILNE